MQQEEMENNILLDEEQIDLYILQLKTQEQFLDGLYKYYKFKSRVMGKIALKFKEHLKMFPKHHKDFDEFKNHFANWIGYEVKKGQLGEYLKHQIGEL